MVCLLSHCCTGMLNTFTCSAITTTPSQPVLTYLTTRPPLQLLDHPSSLKLPPEHPYFANSSNMSFDTLSNEMVLETAGHLTMTKDIFALARTSRKYWQLVGGGFLYKNVAIGSEDASAQGKLSTATVGQFATAVTSQQDLADQVLTLRIVIAAGRGAHHSDQCLMARAMQQVRSARSHNSAWEKDVADGEEGALRGLVLLLLPNLRWSRTLGRSKR
jgi:hypothetical protein